MRTLDRPVVQITIRFEYLTLDEVRCAHRSAVVLTRISSSNPVCTLERSAVLCDGVQFQSLETCSRAYRTLHSVFCIIWFMNHSYPAFGTVRCIWINSLSIPAIRRIIYLGTSLGITWVGRCSVGKNILVRCSCHLRECLFLLICTTSGLKVGRSVRMICATYIRISASHNTFFRVEREILCLINSGIDLIGPWLTRNAHLFITGILYNFIWHTFTQKRALDILNNVILF